MYCPKCGSQNADETKFCRGCGVDLSNVLAVIPATPGVPPTTPRQKRLPFLREESKYYSRWGMSGASSEPQSLAEKQVELSSAGWRGLIGGLGFLIVAALSFGISGNLAVLGLFMLVFATVFLAGGISRFIQARGLKKLRESEASGPALTPGQPDYISPTRRLFETDELTADPPSVTEHTTTHLR
jgi:hypothetical protein